MFFLLSIHRQSNFEKLGSLAEPASGSPSSIYSSCIRETALLCQLLVRSILTYSVIYICPILWHRILFCNIINGHYLRRESICIHFCIFFLISALFTRWMHLHSYIYQNTYVLYICLVFFVHIEIKRVAEKSFQNAENI